jgi:excisionase family DNA binding protein
MALTLSDEVRTADTWLTLGQVAEMLQISYRTVQRLTSPSAGRDRLLAARFGGVTRVRRAALDAWLRARERG